MQTAQIYLEVIRKRGERRLELQRVYRNLQNRELFLMAYAKLYRNTGATTPGSDPNDTVDGMSLTRIDNIIRALEAGDYQWKPARRIYIPKANGMLRPLSIPSWEDKLVQEVLRLVLSAYYEPRFIDSSHGFRPGKGCHTALQEIRHTWRGTKWFIEGDILGCFDNIDHQLLLGMLDRNIHDERLMKLLRTMLEAGYLEDWKYHGTWSGTPQGGIISPLLANIFLNELDTYTEEILIPAHTKGGIRRLNPEYAELQYAARRARAVEAIEENRRLRQEMQRLPSRDPQDSNYRRLRYVRYADDFLLGFTGPEAEAQQVKREIGEFLRGLRLEMSTEKTLVTHATTDSARFLGYDVSIIHSERTHNGQRTYNGTPILRVPHDVTRKWIQKYTVHGKPVHRAELLASSDYDIVATYATELNGLVNYYVLANDVSWKLHPVEWVMEQSLVKTLASKHKQHVTWVYRQHSRRLDNGSKAIVVEIEREGKKPLRTSFGGKSIRFQIKPIDDTKTPGQRGVPQNKRSELITRLLADQCELCGSTDHIEVHHIRKLSDLHKKKAGQPEPPEWVQRMIAMRRKTLVVCHKCHVAITHGVYDGVRLK